MKDRYPRAHAVEEEGKNRGAIYTVETLTGRHTWLTEDGPVVIEVRGDLVLVSESLDQDTTARVEREVFASPVAKGN
jgi:hypothetical protein